MTRQNRSVRRNNGKRLTRRMRGGAQQPPAPPPPAQQPPPPPPPPQQAAQQAAPTSRFRNFLGNAQSALTQGVQKLGQGAQTFGNTLIQEAQSTGNTFVDFTDIKVLKSLARLHRTYPDLYNVMAQFNKTDTDGSGKLEEDEFIALMRTYSQTDAEVNKALFNHIAGTDKKINLKEFLDFHKYMTMFKQLDNNGDGSISKEEFLAVFPNHDEKFSTCDKSGDGSLDIGEFITCMILAQPAASAQGGRSSSRKYKYTNKLRNSRRSY